MELFTEILTSYLFQVIFTIGIIILFGFVIGLVNRAFYANCGSRGRAVCYVTGFIGTPVHELSHALFCLIFGHRINEIKLFQINSADGVLGYVNHSYNKRNFYQRLGNFFIGIAPIIGISAVLFLLAYLLMPSLVGEISDASAGIATADMGLMFESMINTIATFFKFAINWQWWVFTVISVFLSLHMTLSKADVEGAVSGLVFVLLAFLVVDVVLGLISRTALSAYTGFMLGAGGYLFCFLSLGLMSSLVALIISLIIRLILRARR